MRTARHEPGPVCSWMLNDGGTEPACNACADAMHWTALLDALSHNSKQILLNPAWNMNLALPDDAGKLGMRYTSTCVWRNLH